MADGEQKKLRNDGKQSSKSKATEKSKTDKTPNSEKKFSLKDRPALLIFLLALAIRLVYLVTLAAQPGFSIPIVDEVDYDRIARAFASGQGYDPGPFFRPPLWPTFLGIIYLLFGPAFPFARLANVLLGALAVNASYRLGTKLFNKKVAFAAGIVLSFQGLLVHFSGTGLITSLLIYLTIESINLTLIAREKPSIKRYVFAGILWGLTAITRPVALIPVALVCLDILFRRRIDSSLNMRFAGSFVLAVVLAIAPVTFRNMTQGDPVLISVNGGINFYLGNNSQANGYTAFHPELGVFWTPEKAHAWAEQKTGRIMSPSEVSSFYYKEGLRYLVFNPGDGLKLLGKKLFLAFGSAEVSNNGDLDFMANRNPLLKLLLFLGFGLIAPFAIVGIINTWKYPEKRLVAGIALLYLLSIILFFFSARFRMPTAAIFTLFAVNFIMHFKIEELKWRRELVNAVLVFVLIFLLNRNFAGVPIGGNPAYGNLLLGQVLVREGKSIEAMSSFRAALEHSPTTPLANLYLGQLSMQQGRAAEAVEYFLRELESSKGVEAYRGLGLAYRQLDMRNEAEDAFRNAVQLAPKSKEIRTLLAQEIGERGLKEADSGEWEKAQSLFKQAADIDPLNPFFPFAISSSLWAQGREDEANQIIVELLKIYPNFEPAVEWKNGWRPQTDETGSFLMTPEKPDYSPVPVPSPGR